MRLSCLFLFFISFQAQAILPFEDAVSPEFVTSARALAMGNAYASKVDDGWAAFYNPAGLGTVRGLQMHFTNLHLETNDGFINVAGSAPLSEAASNYQSAFDPVGLRQLHAENPGNISHARFQVFPNITYRGISLGYMYVQQNRARLKSLADDFEIAERKDWGPVLAFSASLMGGIIKFGATGVLLTRMQMQKDFAGGAAVSIDKQQDYVKGSMTHLTAATRITVPVALLPTISVVSRNSSDGEFHTPEFSGVPEAIPQTTDISLALTPNLGRTFRMHVEVIRKDFGDRYDTVPTSRKLMGGLEFDYMRKMFFRLGFGDGWGSGGIGVRNQDFAFDMTTYAIEASDEGYREQEDRRTVISVSGGF